MLRTMNENVAIANNMFVVNESALRALVTSGEFYDLSDKETLYSVSNRRQIVAAMFAAQNKGNLTYEENATLQKISKGYAVEAVMLAADRILSETAQIAETVVDEIAELRTIVIQQAKELDKVNLECRALKADYNALRFDYNALFVSAKLSVKGIVTNTLKQLVKD